MFRGGFKPWKWLREEASRFASGLKPDELITISHSCDQSDGDIVVGYWE
jgi:hypothetical protein